MIKKIFAIFILVLAMSAVNVSFVPQTASAACSSRFLGIPAWYEGLTDGSCNMLDVNSDTVGGLSGLIWTIALNIVEAGLVIVIYVTVFFILYGGFKFLTGGSNPEQTSKARKTIINAVIGLVISMASIAIVNLISGIIK